MKNEGLSASEGTLIEIDLLHSGIATGVDLRYVVFMKRPRYREFCERMLRK